jgi:Ca-activated chloride channel family protein
MFFTIVAAVFAAVIPLQDQPVQVKIVSPVEGHRLTDDSVVELEVILAPGEVLKTVEVFLDDLSLGVRNSPPYSFALKRLSPGSVHRLKAVAETESGYRAVDTLLLSEGETRGIPVRVDLVTLYVSVTDQAGNYERGLTQEDFVIEEDGVRQEISFFTSEYTPLTLALLIDVSSSMIGDRIIRSQEAAADLVDTLIKEEDRAMVLGFDHRLLMFQPLTNNKEELFRAIRMTGPNGGTALYDAVAGTTRKLFNLKGKRAVIVLSDGDDTDSGFGFDEVLDYLQNSSVIVYSVGLQTLTVAQTFIEDTKKTIRELRTLAEITGGQAYFPSFISHLPGVYAAIGQDLSSQYTIAYYPANKVRDGKWRNLTVRVAGKPELNVRHRKGYYATP